MIIKCRIMDHISNANPSLFLSSVLVKFILPFSFYFYCPEILSVSLFTYGKGDHWMRIFITMPMKKKMMSLLV